MNIFELPVDLKKKETILFRNTQQNKLVPSSVGPSVTKNPRKISLWILEAARASQAKVTAKINKRLKAVSLGNAIPVHV